MKSAKRQKREHTAGIIEKMELINFMCHSYLKIDFIPYVNFIVGHNGSGKSAILTGLTVALGGRATFTQRAASVKGLIKEGFDVAKVSVRLGNEGEDAYLPDVYGSSIIIERQISKTTSSYKIKSENGKVLGTKHDDLQKILDHFELDVENPMTILTQDTSRMFLANSTPADKYQFFMRGTQLEKLRSDYAKFDESVLNLKKTIDRKRGILPELAKTVQELQAKWKDLEEARNMGKTVNDLQAQLVWSQVEVIEKRLKESEDVAKEFLENSKEANENYLAEKQQYDKAIVEHRKFAEELSEKERNFNDLSTRYNEEVASAKSLKRSMDEASDDLENCQKQVNETRSACEDLEQRIENETRKLETDQHECEVGKQRVFSTISKVRSDRQEIGRKIDELQTRASKKMEEMEQIKRNVYHTKDQIDSLNKSNSKYAAYGGRGNVESFLKEVKSTRWKGSLPIGPFGTFVTLERPEYQNIIESLLGKSLNAMGVENQEDYKLLSSIMRRHNCTFSIYKYKAEKIDFSEGMAPNHLLTVYKCLKISNPVVLNQLIINNNIEKTVLVENHYEGDKVVLEKFRNVIGVYTKTLQKCGTSYGGLGTFLVPAYNGIPRLNRSNDEIISSLRRKLEDYNRKMSELTDEIEAIRREQETLRGHGRQAMQYLEQYDREVANYDSQIQALREKLLVNEPANISGLETLLEENRDQLKIYEAQLKTVKNAQVELYQSVAEKSGILRNMKKEIEHLKEEKDKLKKIKYQHSINVERSEKGMDHWLHQQAKYQAKYDTQVKSNNEIKSELDEKIPLCEASYKRCAVTMDPEDLKAEITRLKSRISEREKIIGTREAISKELKQKRDEYHLIENEVSEADSLVQCLANTSTTRQERYKKFVEFVTIRAQRIFSQLLHKRGFRGQLMIDHKVKKLDLEVDVHIEANVEKDQKLGKNPSSLSGGEKSYSTICLLLALWQSMFSPFRCLDEFDVFMDAVNRRLAMKLIIEHSKELHTKRSQFILITPQGMNQVEGKDSPDVRIIMLDDPVRGQQRLPFKPAGLQN